MNTQTDGRSTARIVFAAAALCAGLFVSSTFAAVPGEPLQQKVSYGDLDLTRAEGVAALYKRVRSAAANVCSPFESRELALRSEWRACVDSSISRAIAQINVPALTAYADARSDHTTSPLTVDNVP